MEGTGTETDPYQITDWNELDEVRDDTTAYYQLQNNLDDSIDGYDSLASDTANSGNGWSPIGGFSGNLDGNGFFIEDLYIDREGDLQGFIADLQGNVSNLGLINGYVKGANAISLLVAYCNTGTIEECYVHGTVEQYASAGADAGGLVGGMEDTIVKNCYADVDVSGQDHNGGLVGALLYGDVENCYSIGSVSSSGSLGGAIGFNDSGTVNDCFFDQETAGTTTSNGATAKTTSEMKDVATYTDTSTAGLNSPWDFVDNPNDDDNNEDIWYIDQDEYPLFVSLKSKNGIRWLETRQKEPNLIRWVDIENRESNIKKDDTGNRDIISDRDIIL